MPTDQHKARTAEGLLSDLRDIVAEIKEGSRFESGVLNRYVSFDRARSLLSEDLPKEILKSGKFANRKAVNLALSDAETMDDPTEGWYLIKCSEAEVSRNGRALSNLFNSSADNVVSDRRFLEGRSGLWSMDPGFSFICSMTSEKDDLALWRYYSERGGVAFRFFWADNSPVPVYRVQYGEKAATAAANRLGWVLYPLLKMRDPDANRRARAIVRSLRFLFKTHGHAGDEELRAIVEVGDPDYCMEYAESALATRSLDNIEYYRPNSSEPDVPPPPIRLQIVVPEVLFKSPHRDNAIVLSPGLIAHGSDEGLGYEKEMRYWLRKRDLADVDVIRSQHRLGRR